MSPASTSTALTTKVESGSPYQLSSEQVLKASTALLTHIKAASTSETPEKKSLLAPTDEEDEEDTTDSPVVWLTINTKKHIVDQKALKPKRLNIPHSITSPTATICLIVADPQRTFKDIVASEAFPVELSKRITRVIGIDKIKKKYDRYEAQRQLKSEYDLFLADDRIVNLVPRHLGKVFYKSTANRPIPVQLASPAPKEDGKRIKRKKGEDDSKLPAATPKLVAAAIEKALSGAMIHLTPSVSTSIRVGNASLTASQLAENIEAVALQVIEGIVPKKWRNVRAIYVKGEKSASLPIWLADELWVEEKDVLDDETVEKLKLQEANVGKKRKAIGAPAVEEKEAEGESGSATKKKKGGKKQKLVAESNDDKLDEEIKARRETLRKQKELASGEVEDDVPKPSKKKWKKAEGVEA